MKKFVPLTVLIIGILALASGAEAQRRMGQQRNRSFTRSQSGWILMALKARQLELNITDDQLAEIEDLSLKMEEQKVEHQNAMNTHRLELKKLMMEREYRDYDKIESMLIQNAEGRAVMMVSQMKLRDQIDSILSPEQKEALKTMGRGQLVLRRQGIQRGREFQRNPRLRRFRRAPEDTIK
ncbi:MAG: Spy/CpxP family protein refolding chaperone [Candidatus Aminicenantaceae bacterium]